jgi:translation initiation factor 2 subunit 2
MEEFEKEFGDAPEASATAKPKKAKKVVEESDDEADGEDGEGDFDEVEEVDEEELGENPFANSGGGGRGDADEPWLDSDRDYTYDEVTGTIDVWT